MIAGLDGLKRYQELNATSEQRNKFELSGGGTGIHWEGIDEDISVSGLILGNKDLTYYKKMT